MKRACFLIFFACLLVLMPIIGDGAENQHFPMEASFLENQAKPGDVVRLKLSYSLPKGASLSEKPVLQGLEQLSVLSIKYVSDGIIVKLLVDTLDPFKVPALTLRFIDADKREQKMVSKPVQLTVTSTIKGQADTLDIRPIKGIMPVDKGLLRKGLPFLTVALVLLLAFLIWRIWNKRKRQSEETRYIEPPDVEALRALNQLNQSGLFEKGKIKDYYFSLSEIVRRYMEKIRPFPAFEWTTDEISAHIDDEEDRKIVRLLRLADLVKFANERPTLAQKDEHWSMAREYVEKTRPRGTDDSTMTPPVEQ